MVQTTDVGTIRYMAPEIVFGPYDHRADIYSWGLAWELLIICMRPSASPHALFKRAVGRGAAHAHVERAASERRPQDGLAVDGEPHRELLAHVARPAPIHETMTEVVELELTVVERMQRIQAQAAGDGGDSV